jgi:hypothetical protein
MNCRMIQTIKDAESWLEAKGGTWTRVRTAEGWDVIAWVGPFSRRRAVREATIEAALIDAVGQLVRDPVLS